MSLQSTGLRWINEGLSSFMSGVNAAASGIKSFYTETGKSVSYITGFTNHVGHAATAIDYLIRRVILLTAAYAAIGAIREWISTGFEQLALLDQLNKSTQALVATQLVETGAAKNFNDALVQGAQKASELFEWNKKLAVVSIFTTEQVTELQQMAMAVGITADQAKILVADFVTWGTVANKPFSEVKGGLKAITDMFAKQKVQAEEMTRQLTNAGIPAWQFLADALHVTVAKAQEMVTQGLVPANFAISAIADRMGSTYGPALKNFAFSWAGLTSSMQDVKNLGLANFFQGVADAFRPFAERFVAVMLQPETMQMITRWGVALGEVAGKLFSFAEAAIASGDPIAFIAVAINNVIPGFYNLYQAVVDMAGMFSKLAGAASGWGSSIGYSFAEGIIQSATYIIQALTYIGNIIAYWLSPGSPPKVAPDLPQWGAAAATEWYKGWTQADGKELQGMMDIIKNALDNLVSSGALSETGVIPKLLGGENILAEATYQIQKFGDVSVDTLSSVNQWASDTSPEIQNLVSAYFELEKASRAVSEAEDAWAESSKAVKEAQEELNRVNKEFEDRLKPINDALKKNQAEQARIRDQERIEQLKKKIDSDKSTPEEKRLAALEIEQIQLEASIRTEKEKAELEKDSAVNVAQAKLDAAKADEEAKQKQLDTAKEQEKAAKSAYDNVNAQIQLQSNHNKLLEQQVSLLDKIQKANEAAAKKAAGGGGGLKGKGPGLPEGAGGPLNLAGGILGDVQSSLDAFNQKAAEAKQHWDDLKQRFLEAKAAAEQAGKALAPLSPLAGGIGLAFGSLAAGGIITFILSLVRAASPIGALIFAGTLLYKGWTENWFGIRDTVLPIIDKISEKISFFITGFQRWTSGMESGKTFLESLGISPDVVSVISGIGSAVSESFNFISIAIQRLVSGQEGFTTFADSIIERFTGIKLAGTTVSDFWNNVLVPAANDVANFFRTELVPIIDQVALWFTTHLQPSLEDLATKAMPLLNAAGNLLASIWTNVIGPAANMLWTILRDLLFPVIAVVGTKAVQDLVTAFGTFLSNTTTVFNFLADSFLPIFKDIFNFVSDPLVPLVVQLARLVGEILRIAFEVVTAVVNGFWAGLKTLGEWISKAIDWLWGQPNSLTKVIDGAKKAISETVDAISELFRGLGSIKGAIDGFIGKIKELIDWLSKIHVPDALLQHSPSEMEQAITSVGSAIDDLIVILNNANAAFSSISWKQGFSEDMQKALEKAIKDAKAFIEKMAQLKLSATIGGFDVMISNLQKVRSLYDDINKVHDDYLNKMKEVGSLQDQAMAKYQDAKNVAEEGYALLAAGRTEEANAKFAEAAWLRDQAAKLSDQANTASQDADLTQARAYQKQQAADRREAALEAARQEYLKNAATDPDNAEKLFDLKSKQINALADLDQQIADAKDQQTKESLEKERAFLVQKQAYELELFKRQAKERVQALSDELKSIFQQFSDIFTSEHIDQLNEFTKAYSDLFDALSKFKDLDLPDWLTPGSPTPLENALVGVTRSMKELSNNALPSFTGRVKGIAGASQIFNGASKSYYSKTNNYNLGVTTNQSPQAAFQSFELMKSIYA